MRKETLSVKYLRTNPMLRGNDNGLKIRWAVRGPCRFESGHRHSNFTAKNFTDGSAGRTALFFIPVILGTSRQGRRSEAAANFVFAEMQKRAGIETQLIDIRELPLRLDDAGEQMKDREFFRYRATR